MRIPLAFATFLAALNLVAQPTAPTRSPALSETSVAAASLLNRPELAAYRGWIKFLRLEAETAVARSGADSDVAQEKIGRLADWVARIGADPALLGKLRGVQEWAYESPVDGTGQPFKIMVPTDYDPAQPTPLWMAMHGYTGDHLNHSAGMQSHAGYFEVAVLGRARGGWYVGLSQADVLHVLDYIEAHWRIDSDRIHIGGGSMGGGATFKLGARFPHRFASGQITCGYVNQQAMGNLLTFPIYALHSDDDPIVPILESRGPLAELRRRGGQVIYDETTGFGHAVWDYAAGNMRADAWAKRQVRPDSHTVRHLDFTANDGAAQRCWWAEIAEWGAQPRPARFVATAGANNTLFVELDNVARLRLRTPESPFDPTQALKVVVDGAVPYEVAAPLPDLITVEAHGFAEPEPEPARLHTPGGPMQVYDGSPLLIVYGTGGDDAINAALRAAADSASLSSHPDWLTPGGEFDPRDNVPHAHNLFGRLAMKADRDVTDADIDRCNLVLIGSATENSVVGRMATQLPVRIEAGQIVCSDGFALPAAKRTLGLVHRNPLAPERLVFWVASTEPTGYVAGATVPALASPYFIGADLLVTGATDQRLVATRSFDSRWRWLENRADSPVVATVDEEHAALAGRMAEAVRRATGTDFAVAGRIPQLGAAPITPGVTRAVDLETLFHAHRIDLLELTGAELLAAQEQMAGLAPEGDEWVAFQPAVVVARIDPARRYRVALPMVLVSPFVHATKVNTHAQRRADVTVPEALARYLGRD